MRTLSWACLCQNDCRNGIWWKICSSVLVYAVVWRCCVGLTADHPAPRAALVPWGREWQPGPVPPAPRGAGAIPALGSPCAQPRAGWDVGLAQQGLWLGRLWGAGPAVTWLGQGLVVPGADMGSMGMALRPRLSSSASWSGLLLGRARFRIHYYRNLWAWVFLKVIGGK